MKKRLLSILLVIVMVFSLLPVTAAATDPITVTVAQAATIAAGLANSNAPTEATYSVTGYVTDTNGQISLGQQTFWLDDVKGDKKTFEGYFCNLPKDEDPLNVGDKVNIVGSIMRYNSTYEMKFGVVTIIERASTTYTITTWKALQDAIDAADGSKDEPATETTTIKLTSDLTAPATGGDSITIPAGKDITLDLNGKVINANGKFNAILVEEGGKLTLIDSAPTTEHYFTVDADGLWTLTDTKTETTKTVLGGVITGGTGIDCGEGMGTNGGGVYVYEGTFTMSAGNIVGNKATPSEDGISNGYGGGVSVYEGVFTMSGGTITGNTADAGSVNAYESTFTMSGGAITGNTATYGGGGVYETGGTFTMSGGAISNNSGYYGGSVVVYEGAFTMSGGAISDNNGYLGGGVFVVSGGTFTMNDGAISGNTAAYGGGVYVNDPASSFKMTAGTISGNTASMGGGIQNTGTLKLLAAAGKEIEITGNTATAADGGVANWGEMHLSGKVIIKDNICTNKYDDTVNYPVNLTTDTPINIDGALTGSVIYVTHVNDNDEHNAGVLTSGFITSNEGAKLGDFFTYDGPSSFEMVLNEDGANADELEVKKVSGGGTETTGEWFGYCTKDSQYDTAIGLNDTTTSITWAIRIPANDLPKQDVLSMVSYFVYSNGTYKVRIYETEPGANPDGDDPDYEQDVVLLATQCWKDIILTTPYQIDPDKDLWIGIENADCPYPATCSTEILGTKDCCMMYFQNTWYCIDELGGFNRQPWMIRGYFGTVDAHTITNATTDTNGTVSIDATSAIEGATVRIAVDTDDEYYLLDTLTATYNDGNEDQSVSLKQDETDPTKYSFTMPAYDVTVKATFKSNGKEPPIYRFTFDTDPESSGWKNIDADGDGHKWNWLETNGSMQSVSWSTATSSLYPDNWLISPQISIPADGAEITWDVKSGSTSYQEHYGVYLCTKAEAPSDASDLAANYFQIYEGKSPIGINSFVNHSVIVPAEYNGNDYYIAFRHYDSSDKWSFEIDNFTVKKPGASVVTTWYALQDAIDAADGDATTPATETTTIQLTDDLTAPAEGGATITIPEGKDITLDLNGKILNAGGGAFSVIEVKTGGKLTLIDSAPTAKHNGYLDETGLWKSDSSDSHNGEDDECDILGGVITGGTGVDCGKNKSGGSMGSNGGGVIVSGTFTMNAGNIVGNKAVTGVSDTGKAANGFCGGVYIQEVGAFTMAGGVITGNTARMGGGVFNRGTFTMSGGTISGNTATRNGGGVYNTGTFAMNGGKVNKNTAYNCGGGVYVEDDSTFTMTNGEISGNKSKYGGGIQTEGILKLNAGVDKTITITSNTATSAEGGVANWGEMHLSGAVIIKDNICENTYDDGVNYPKDLATKNPVVIDGALTGSEINITHANSNNDEHDSGVILSGFAENNPGAEFDDFFTYNGPSGFYTLVNDDGDWEMGKANGVSLPTVEVDDGKITSDGEPVEVKDTDGGDVASEKLDDVAAAINEVLDNYQVNSFDETGLDVATEDSNDAIVAALKNQTDDQAAKDAVNETNISKYLNVTLVSAEVNAGIEVTVTAMTFDVTPMATITVTGSNGEVTLTTEITNAEIGKTVTFLLPVDKSIEADTAAVYHKHENGVIDFLSNEPIDNYTIKVKTKSFSEFSYIVLNESTAGAKIGTTLYASLSDAVSEVQNNKTIKLLKNASGTITVSRAVKFKVDANGNTNNAAITAGNGYTVSKGGDTYTISAYGGGGGGSSSYAIELPANVKNGKVEVSPKNASAGQTVTLTVTPDKGFTLETLTVLDKNGKEVEVKNLGNNKFSFTMPSGKVSISATFMEDNSMLNFFVDVKADDYYYDAVLWAAENGITNGVDAVHFGPEIGVTRAQVVTFLWRVAGCPEPVGNSAKFTDLLADQYYIKAVAWAIEQGITKGVTDTTFEPEMVCTRGQIVTFLARFAGVEDADTENVFTDVPANEFFAAAVKWAKDNGVTSGVTDTTFEPYTNCNRAQVMTFLYRWMVK